MTKSSRPLKNTFSAKRLEELSDWNLRAVLARDDVNSILKEFVVIESFPEIEAPIRFTQEEAETIVIRLFERFHKVAVTLRDRTHKKPPFEIEDEYGVQDLLEALLGVYFDDIRPEESTESYGGVTSFIDFLLKRQRIGIEVKHGDRGNRRVREELNSDKYNYRVHTNCTKLLCLVYDPNYKIENPDGFEDDLSDSVSGLETKVFVVPKP